MKISDFLNIKAVKANLTGKTKKELIDELVELLLESGAIEKKSKSKIIEVLLAREALGSTAIGQGIAIPHGKCEEVEKLVGCLGVSKEGIDFDSLDGEGAHIFFMLLAPIDSAGPHLKALARISRLLKEKTVRDSLRNATDDKTLLKIIQLEDNRLSKI
ncbi:MAG: PTS sugar transporter subunit IIA [Candidatus Omnitrophica bacterium]|nr:PTS sugar transporter subunit IIA [Candidatus Omnitrophota bacterium]